MSTDEPAPDNLDRLFARIDGIYRFRAAMARVERIAEIEAEGLAYVPQFGIRVVATWIAERLREEGFGEPG